MSAIVECLARYGNATANKYNRKSVSKIQAQAKLAADHCFNLYVFAFAKLADSRERKLTALKVFCKLTNNSLDLKTRTELEEV